MGDAFLVVWKLQEKEGEERERIADLALMFTIKVMAAVNKSPVLAEYRGHPGLIARIHNYRVKLKFGLHAGWAVEGALGSEFKIDATYLSPDVNLASRLESANYQFKTH